MSIAGRRWLGLLVLATWVVSLFLPVFTTCRPGYDHVEGWFLLAYGWFGIMAYVPAWFANLFVLVVGALLVLEMRVPVWLGTLAALFAATAWWFTDWYDDTGAVPICHYHAGYWIWLGAALIAFLVPVMVKLCTKAT
jgi:hypothetical protein